MAVKLDMDAVRSRLEARYREISEVALAAGADKKPVELDQSRVGRLTRMDALQSHAMSLEVARRRRIELERISAALARLDSGDYGSCLVCGGEIAAKRLDFDPTTPTCIDCATG